MEVFIGLGSGLATGLCMYPLKKANIYIKFVLCVVIVSALVAVHYIYHLFAGEFLCAIIFGYVAQRIWGHDEVEGIPMGQLELLWGFVMPAMFGTIGALLDFKALDYSILGPTVGVVFIGLLWRTFGAFIAIYEKKYSVKEKLYIAIAWLAKGSVVAVCGGMIADYAIGMSEEDGDVA